MAILQVSLGLPMAIINAEIARNQEVACPFVGHPTRGRLHGIAYTYQIISTSLPAILNSGVIRRRMRQIGKHAEAAHEISRRACYDCESRIQTVASWPKPNDLT